MPPFNKKERRRLERLRRRLNHLEARIAQNQYRHLTYDESEAGALRWALGLLEKLNQKGEDSE